MSLPSLLAPPSLIVSGLRFSHGPAFTLALPHHETNGGQVLVLSGRSGAGKTTLLRLFAGLLKPESGSIQLGATELHQLSRAARRQFRLREMGLIFQDFSLLDYLTAQENARLPMSFLDTPSTSSAVVGFDEPALLDLLDLTSLWHRPVRQLSQGERQRVAIVRAFSMAPRFVFADEPTASLDAKRRDRVADLLERYATATAALVVLVTHDPALGERFHHTLNVEALQS